jgi:hypothetical protein
VLPDRRHALVVRHDNDHHAATGRGPRPLTIYELMASPITDTPGGGSSGFVDAPRAQTTASGGAYQTVPLDYGEFYGKDSNVMIVTYRAATKTVELKIHSTKDEGGAGDHGVVCV